jgi:ketosteroid isomerase-like protein
MTVRKILHSVVLIALLGVGCQALDQQAVSLSDEDLDQIRAMEQSHVRYTLDANWDRMNEDYAANVLILPANQPEIRGKQALRQWQDAYPPVAGYQMRFVEIDGRSDMAFVRGEYTVTIPLETGKMVDTGRFLWILKKHPDGRWLVTWDMFQSDQPIAAQ